MKFPLLYTLLLSVPTGLYAQNIRTELPVGLMQDDKSAFENDSTEKTNVPEGLYVWTVDSRFGDIRPADYDTIPHRFQNENFTSGLTGHYNYTGNLGAPRVSKYFSEQGANMQTNPFIFRLPYDFFLKGAEDLLFTNTKSPFTNLTYHSCGNKTNGEDRIRALFSVNAGKRFGMGFKADYLYGRGYYEGQSTADFDGTVYASYRGERYNLHTYFQHTYLKTRENGGIQNDDYVNRPESFPTKYGTADMPVNLAKAWNKIGGNHFFLTHRYSLGFRRYRDSDGKIVKQDQIPQTLGVGIVDSLKRDTLTQNSAQTEDSLKNSVISDSLANLAHRMPRVPRGIDESQLAETEKDKKDELIPEFIPVSSFIHTMAISDNTRYFISNERNNIDNPGYFADFYLPGDSANDRTHHLSVENTVAFELHEGFNKWMKMGLRLYGKHEFAMYEFRMPTLPFNRVKKRFKENYITLGGQLLKQQGKVFRYNVLGEFRTTGKDWGEFNVEADAQLNIPLRKDSIHFVFNGFVRNERPSFYYRHYRGRNAWWDNDLDKMFHARVGATLRYRKTALTATLENIQNYIHFQEILTPYNTEDGFVNYRHSIGVSQASKNTQLFALTLNQDFRWGIFNWENELTYQGSTNKDVFPVPTFTGYTNVYLLFRIAKVLRTEIGADLRYFTRYKAPAYSPIIGQYAVQDQEHYTEVGNYPTINVYANFHLKRTRFYVMASHVNYSSGTGNPFLVPHYPLNRLVFRLGLSWNFVN